ncbi:MAG: TetR/AcrR family transcriptional regulator [Pseudomonadales bacterium]
MSDDTGKVVDGRRQRTERSRDAIIDAMLALIEEGNLAPSAQQVSERAGVGIRSVFRHFSEMEQLFALAEERTRESDAAIFAGGNREGTLEERILHAVEQHAEGYEAKANILLSTQSQRWRYPTVRKNYARVQRRLRKDLSDWLPELDDIALESREAIDAIASFEMWYRLREHQGLSKKISIGIISQLIASLLLPQQ